MKLNKNNIERTHFSLSPAELFEWLDPGELCLLPTGRISSGIGGAPLRNDDGMGRLLFLGIPGLYWTWTYPKKENLYHNNFIM